VVVNKVRFTDIRPGTSVDLSAKDHALHQSGIGAASDVAIEVGLDDRRATDRAAALYFLNLAVARVSGDGSHVTIGVGIGFELGSLIGSPGCRKVVKLDLIAGSVCEDIEVVRAVVDERIQQKIPFDQCPKIIKDANVHSRGNDVVNQVVTGNGAGHIRKL